MRMIRLFGVLLLACVQFAANAQSVAVKNLIPTPLSVKEQKGSLVVLPNVSIKVDNNEELKSLGNTFATRLKALGINASVSKNEVKKYGTSVKFSLGKIANPQDEAYSLTVTKNGIELKANKPAGIFYGVQTLVQLFPATIESVQPVAYSKIELPLVQIEDYPRFEWRGLMLDVVRHFFTKEEVKRFIDDMVKYKFNRLHWHLTDDQGWRIEIKSYPKLTEVGAWREDKTGRFMSMSIPEPGEPKTYGGYYTQEDIKEIIAYAQERYVEILPEIDVPGHSAAAIAAYPWLTCTEGDNYTVNAGEPVMVWPGGGKKFYAIKDNNLCPANEDVYTFLDKVFGEVAALFPSEYIHLGGDEAARNFWEKSEKVQQLMKDKNLKNLDEVQSYFIKRVAKIIESKGKKVIGWDEIMEGGLAENAIVMSWQGVKGGIKASQMGHDVIMTPTTFVYLDYMQGEPLLEPKVYASLRLKKTFEYDPIPEGAIAKHIKGGQGNLWAEQIYTFRQVQYMIWPRAFAIAEALWSNNREKNFMNFVGKIESHFKRLDAAQTKYAPSIYDADFKATKTADNKLQVELIPEIEGLTLHYSFDNSLPDNFYPAYTQPLIVPKDATQMRVISYREGKPIGRMLTMPVSELKTRAGFKE